MGERQVAELAKLIYDDFYYLNFDDLKLCFDNAKKGKYGKIYDRIDGNIVMEWLSKYSQERVDVVYPEINYQPRQAIDNRVCNTSDEDFQKFRASYIINKKLQNENKQK